MVKSDKISTKVLVDLKLFRQEILSSFEKKNQFGAIFPYINKLGNRLENLS